MMRKKRVQMATMFQILASGRPMVEYEERRELYDFLEVPEMPKVHWTDNSAWCMAEAMFNQVIFITTNALNFSFFHPF